jgi:CDP-diacylglycerol--glycerol-3-phosphate 3-phosphatidyltransferase
MKSSESPTACASARCQTGFSAEFVDKMIDNERSPKQVMVVAELAKQYSTRGACEAVASIYDLKPRFQALLRPITNSLAAKGVTANQVTIAAAIVSLATGAIVAARPESRPILLLVPLVLFVRMALNAIDGMLAREHNMKSRRGAVLNELGDVVSDAGIYLPMALVLGMPAALLVVLVVLGIISEMAGVVAVQIGAERRYDGPLGKSDRAFAFGLIAFLLGCGVPEEKWLTWLFAILIVMASVTIIRRGRRARILADESATN